MKRKYYLIFLIFFFITADYSHTLTQEELYQLYGDGLDGTIIIKSGYTVDIKALYENDEVSGVETSTRGFNMGLNHGAGSYNPQAGNWINAVHFIIEPDAILTATAAVGKTGDLTNGVIAVKCLGNFINNGTIDLNGKGYAGSTNQYESGYGPGGAPYSRCTSYGRGAPGGTTYSFSLKNVNLEYLLQHWEYLYGSGGASGQKGNYDPGDGGNGGGALLIKAYNIFDTMTGSINVNGASGYGGNVTGDEEEGCSGGGGGGAGGTIYIIVHHYAYLGINRITVSGGAGGSDAGPGSQYPNHGGGGGGGANFYNGYSGGNQHGVRYSGPGGYGSVGRIHVKGNFSGITSSPPLLELTEIISE